MTTRGTPEVIQLRHGLRATVLTHADLGRKKPRKRSPRPTPPPERDEYDHERDLDQDAPW